jgi:dTMP kinase
MDNTKKNLFITFEGIDGAGKSSQIQQMYALLKEEGYSVLLTHEPGGTPLGEKIREILLQKTDLAIEPNAEMILFLAGRSQHLQEVILPALRKGQRHEHIKGTEEV